MDEEVFLRQVRERFAKELDAAPSYADAYGSRRLIRFLRHHKNPEKATSAIGDYLAWRRDNGIDSIRAFVETESDPRRWPRGDFILDRCRVLPCSKALFDRKGNALCVERYGILPANRLGDVKAQDYMFWQLHCLEWKSLQLELLSTDQNDIARLCTVFDLSGLTLAHARLPVGYKMIKQLLQIVQRYYPWLQDTTHLVNASRSTFAAWSLLRPILPKHTRAKIFIHNSTDSLLESIPPDHLPKVLGGRADCPSLQPQPHEKK